VWIIIAPTSEVTKNSSFPIPNINGLPLRAAIILFGSLVLTIFTNALLLIAFYQTSDLSNDQIYPLLSYLLAMFLLIVASLYVFFSKVAKTI